MEAEGGERKKKNATVRHAPPDPSLPAPWKGLIDVATGNLYFWNPLTKVTQYDRPRPEPDAGAATADASNDASNDAGAGGLSPTPTDPTPTPAVDANANTKPPTPTQQPLAVILNPNPNPNPHPPPATAPNDISPDAYRRQHEIAVLLHGASSPPPPFTTFESTRFPPGLIRALYSAGFSRPSPIQAQSWPIALQGRDLIAVAKTGSGKTLGFLLPAFLLLKRLCHDRTRGPSVLVLSPTRELATQIQDQALKFGRPASIATTALYGGAPKGPQLQEVQRGTDVVVATPGRLNDILEMGKLSLQQVAFLVLDEADRMLDMGFEPQIRKIATHLPPRRQTLMFTATWPREVRDIASHLLRNPVQVSIGNTDTLTANKAITQHVEVISPMEKRRRLDQILRSQDPNAKTIIFCSTKKMCDMLARNLQQNYGAAAIHGDKSQPERDSVLADFRAGRSRVLVATDVASRGLDIKDIKVVVNYDFPSGVEDYVHRIGRTGRAGATGTAFTFFCDQDGKYATELVKVLEGAGQKVPPELRDMVGRGGYGGRPRRWESSNTGGCSNGTSSGNTWGASACGESSGGGGFRSGWGVSDGAGPTGASSGGGWGSSGNKGFSSGGNGSGSGSAWGSSGGGGSNCGGNGSGSAWGSSGGGGSNCGGNGSGSAWGSSGGGTGWGSAT